MTDLDTDDDAVDRRQGLLHLQPAEPAPAGRVDRSGVLDHQALVPAFARAEERVFETLARRDADEVAECERAAVVGKGQAKRF